MSLQPMPVIPVDVEVSLVAWLKVWLDGRTEDVARDVRVSSVKGQENAATPKSVGVRRDGGAIVGPVDQPRVAVRVWAPTDDEASELARLLMAGIKASPGHNAILSVPQLFGPSPVVDASQPQYLINAELRTRCIPA